MDTKDDVTLQVLIDIRDEIRATNNRLDGTNQRVDGLNQRVDGLEVRMREQIEVLREEVGQRIAHSEIRLATAITDVHGTMIDVKTMLGAQLDLRERVVACERDIAELKRKNKKSD